MIIKRNSPTYFSYFTHPSPNQQYHFEGSIVVINNKHIYVSNIKRRL